MLGEYNGRYLQLGHLDTIDEFVAKGTSYRGRVDYIFRPSKPPCDQLAELAVP